MIVKIIGTSICFKLGGYQDSILDNSYGTKSQSWKQMERPHISVKSLLVVKNNS